MTSWHELIEKDGARPSGRTQYSMNRSKQLRLITGDRRRHCRMPGRHKPAHKKGVRVAMVEKRQR